MLTITQEVIDTIIDLAEEYANARVEYLAAEGNQEKWIARCAKVAKYKDFSDYLNQLRAAQNLPGEVPLIPLHTEFKAAREAGFQLELERRKAKASYSSNKQKSNLPTHK